VINVTDLGILFYGYTEDSAQTIAESVGDLLEKKVHIYGAFGQEESTVQNILDGSMQGFGEGEPKVMMMLGFDSDQIGIVLKRFPEGIPRPIFCGLTEENLYWKISRLTEHLIEEERYWKKEARKKKEEKENTNPPGNEPAGGGGNRGGNHDPEGDSMNPEART